MMFTNAISISLLLKNKKFQLTFNINWATNNIATLLVILLVYKKTIYAEKQTIIVIQAAPKTQPSGVQGALLSCKYHSLFGPAAMNKLPMPNAPKLMIKKIMNGFNNFMMTYFEVSQFHLESSELRHIFYRFLLC